MFRKLLLASVASLGLVSPLALAPKADAHDFREERGHERHHVYAYRVFYRDPCRPGWTFAGRFHDYREAARVAEPYRCRGLAVSIR